MSFSLTAAHRRITNQMQFTLVEHMNFWAKLNLFVINEKKDGTNHVAKGTQGSKNIISYPRTGFFT